MLAFAIASSVGIAGLYVARTVLRHSHRRTADPIVITPAAFEVPQPERQQLESLRR